MSTEFDAVPARPLTPWQAGVGVGRFHATGSSHGFEVLDQFSALTIAGGSSINKLLCSRWHGVLFAMGTPLLGIAALGGACFHASSSTYSVTASSMARFRINDLHLDIADQPLVSERE
ncbi:hypothetical protein GGI16_000843 [Coemansia sp. S142-1]|nr:hypothetical protein GGI16_000843 [Coemansia sp. S142-1]